MRATLVLLVSISMIRAGDPLKIGGAAPKLTLTDIRSLPRSLDELGEKKAFVLVFINTTCPVAQRYVPTLKDLAMKYPDVRFAAVNPCDEDSLIDMATHAVKYDIPFPVFKDFEGEAAKALGVRRTPEAVLLDAKKTLRYRGRIDDQYRLGGVKKQPTSNELADAIEAILNGKEIAKTESEVDGCPITFPTATPPQKVNYAEHVAPILKTHCWACHQPDGSAPFALTSHHQASSRANAILETITDQRMPPWFASHEFGPFINARGMNDREKTVLRDWVKNGAPQGDMAKAPALPEKPKSEWKIPEPDLVLQTIEINIPASGEVPYQYAVLPFIFMHDTWVKQIEILPTNPRVLHHGNMAFAKLTEKFDENNFITGYVPGGEAVNLEEGVAVKIPAGAVLGLQLHFVSTGKPEKCTIKVGLRFPRETVQKQLLNHQLTNRRFTIPPGAEHHKISAAFTLDRDVHGVGLFSHMHLRGKDMTFTAKADGQEETLLIVPNYNFSWQVPYRWEPGKKFIKKGTKIDCTAHYDNSSFNPYNPDPKSKVKTGLQTHDEMMVGFFFFTDANEKLNLTVDSKNGKAR